ncbi:uncharacterized protein METZ01_LOCUS364261 [marine metagenome]|uniref:Uncharacterized protein n=1 Tax=marine metagenome TaxID=408172 RepID=A0A382SQD3_9ZZZZ
MSNSFNGSMIELTGNVIKFLLLLVVT